LGLYGENQLVYLATKLSAETNVPFTLGRKIISKAKKLNFQNIPSEWEERYLHLAYDLGFFEGMFIDKLAIDACFNDLREYKVPTYPYTRRNLRKLVDDQTPQYVVIKLNKLRACKGISVRTPERLQSVGHIHEGMGLIEAFVPSKEIRSDKNHKKYDGCMRYIVLVEETKERELNIHHFGGYWRLCFLPIKHYGMNMAMLAGLGNGAIPQMACRYELEQVRDTLNILVPRFYQNLVSKLNT
jgi:hypothetical protein